jgi:hypothetical protein
MSYRRRVIGVAALCVPLLVGCVPPTGPGGRPLPRNCVRSNGVVRCTFAYNGKDGSDGSPQQFVVPSGVDSVAVDAFGAQGGNGGGLGGNAGGTFSAAPGTVLHIRVGGSPTSTAGGYNGGGAGDPAGGGASDVRIGGTSLADRVVVAGGGGGEGRLEVALGPPTPFQLSFAGGLGGGASGGDGDCALPPPVFTMEPGCGTGGTPATGGNAGPSSCHNMTQSALVDAKAGASGAGGAGADITCSVSSTNGDITFVVQGAGGGGGWFGGGGAGALGSEIPAGFMVGAAGGGSGYVSPSATAPVNEPGVQTANGTVFVSYHE